MLYPSFLAAGLTFGLAACAPFDQGGSVIPSVIPATLGKEAVSQNGANQARAGSSIVPEGYDLPDSRSPLTPATAGDAYHIGGEMRTTSTWEIIDGVNFDEVQCHGVVQVVEVASQKPTGCLDWEGFYTPNEAPNFDGNCGLYVVGTATKSKATAVILLSQTIGAVPGYCRLAVDSSTNYPHFTCPQNRYAVSNILFVRDEMGGALGKTSGQLECAAPHIETFNMAMVRGRKEMVAMPRAEYKMFCVPTPRLEPGARVRTSPTWSRDFWEKKRE
ncbi:MAG: hypothetical protein M1829_001264 [Trizodia sp. TS-e1964]|nr:MAG: hypothetical protein M1829_001264 [Trizodia sp. TS-e1964]